MYIFIHSLTSALEGGDRQLHIPSQETQVPVWEFLEYRKNLVTLENRKDIPQLSRP